MNAAATMNTTQFIRQMKREFESKQKQRLIIAKGRDIKKTDDETSIEGMTARLKMTHSREEIDDIMQIEEYYNYRMETGKGGALFHYLYGEIANMSIMYERKYAGYRISRHDFETAFFIELARLTSQEKTNPKYTFYETFRRSMSFRAKDVARKHSGMRNKQTRFEIEAIPFEQHHEYKIVEGIVYPTRSSIEERFEAGEAVDEMINSDKTTADERRLILTMLDNPDESLRGLARICGFSNHKKVQRLLTSIRSKHKQLNPFI